MQPISIGKTSRKPHARTPAARNCLQKQKSRDDRRIRIGATCKEISNLVAITGSDGHRHIMEFYSAAPVQPLNGRRRENSGERPQWRRSDRSQSRVLHSSQGRVQINRNAQSGKFGGHNPLLVRSRPICAPSVTDAHCQREQVAYFVSGTRARAAYVAQFCLKSALSVRPPQACSVCPVT